MRKFTAAIGAAAVIISGGFLAAAPALAAPASTVTASTYITGRPDSGGSGNWATDSMTRILTVTSTGGGNYTATVQDTQGLFTTTLFAYTPNQGGSYAGERFITRRHSGTFTGTARYSFTASKAPQAYLVPSRALGSAPTDTSDWYKLAFPAGTVFGGTGIENNWGWDYTATDACVTPTRGYFTISQHWADTAANGGGQLPGDGQIQDLPAAECPA